MVGIIPLSINTKTSIMEQSTHNQKGKDNIREIISKAWEDETFKQELINNPKATLEKFLGKTIETDKEIVFIDQSNPECLYIPIPAKPQLDDMELSEDQLELVAGGADGDDEVSFWDVFTYVVTHPLETLDAIANS